MGGERRIVYREVDGRIVERMGVRRADGERATVQRRTALEGRAQNRWRAAAAIINPLSPDAFAGNSELIVQFGGPDLRGVRSP